MKTTPPKVGLGEGEVGAEGRRKWGSSEGATRPVAQGTSYRERLGVSSSLQKADLSGLDTVPGRGTEDGSSPTAHKPTQSHLALSPASHEYMMHLAL